MSDFIRPIARRAPVGEKTTLELPDPFLTLSLSITVYKVQAYILFPSCVFLFFFVFFVCFFFFFSTPVQPVFLVL